MLETIEILCNPDRGAVGVDRRDRDDRILRGAELVPGFRLVSKAKEIEAALGPAFAFCETLIYNATLSDTDAIALILRGFDLAESALDRAFGQF